MRDPDYISPVTQTGLLSTPHHSTPTLSSSSAAEPLPLKILTHNIRYATQHPFAGELPWPQRLPGLLAELRYHTRHNGAAVICLQEVLYGQLLDVLAGLNGRSSSSSSESSTTLVEDGDEWAHYGRGRDDGCQAGEYSPILYRAAVWELRSARTVWLSPTPQISGSKGWDAASVRICGLVVLEERRPGFEASAGTSGRGRGRRLVVMNTHLDDQGRRSRIEGAKIILREMQKVRHEWQDQGGVDGVVLAGDLNSEAPTSEQSDTRRRGEDKDEDEDAYSILNAPHTALRDIRPYVPAQCRYGHQMTFTGFDGRGDADGRCRRIDFIHIGISDGSSDEADERATSTTSASRDGHGDGKGPKNEQPQPQPQQRYEEEKKERRCPRRVEGYAVPSNRFDDGIYISDHRAVVGDLLLR